MKKIFKTLTLAGMIGAMALCTASAKGNNKNRMPLPGNNAQSQQVKAAIGQVTAVGTDSFTFKDADGNESTVLVNPFTRFTVSTASTNSRKDNRNDSSLSELKKDDWVSVRVMNTDTKNKIAAHVMIKR